MTKFKYKPVTPSVVDALKKICGEKYVLFNDPEKMEMYSHDEVAEKDYARMPDVVVKPRTTEEIAEIMKLTYREDIPVTPRGAGSGLSGGAVPVYGGIVLSVERMNKILEIDKENMMMVLEPGVVTNDVNAAIKDDGLFYAGYPMSVETCFIGGNVAENAGGGRAVKYGVTERYIRGLEVVTPTGDVIRLGGKIMKDVTGYDLIHLMVGSEGTLGIFTKILIKLLPLPTARVDLLVLFKDVKSAIDMVPVIMTNGRIIPTAIEFMDQLSARTSCEYLNEKIPYEKAGAMLLIEVDGNSLEIVESDYETIGELCFEHGALEVYVADNYTTSERVWKVRRNIAEAFKVYSPHQSLEDIVVPISTIPAFMPELDRIAKNYDVKIPCYGHAGDGNLHATVVKNPASTMDAWHEMLPKILTEIYKVVARLGGTISGEHGIGSKRKAFLPLVMSEAEIDIMRKIKLALDPRNILNPGKIFDV